MVQRSLLCCVSFALGFCITTPAHAQAWPSHTVRIVVPFAAGGGTDVLTRLLSATPRERLGRMNAEVVKALRVPDIRNAILKEGGDPTPPTPDEMAALFKSDVTKYARVIKAANVQTN